MDASSQASAAGIRSRSHPRLRLGAAGEQLELHDGRVSSQLPKKFTLSHLQRVYEAVLGRTLDKRNFRRKMAVLDILTPLDEWVQDGPSHPGNSTVLNRGGSNALRDKGILFPF